MNSSIERRFYVREKRLQRVYEIEEDLYNYLKYASKKYRGTISDLFNFCIRELVETKKFRVCEFREKVLYQGCSFDVDESNIRALNELKDKTRYTLVTLVSMAIRNVMDEEDWVGWDDWQPEEK